MKTGSSLVASVLVLAVVGCGKAGSGDGDRVRSPSAGGSDSAAGSPGSSGSSGSSGTRGGGPGVGGASGSGATGGTSSDGGTGDSGAPSNGGGDGGTATASMGGYKNTADGGLVDPPPPACPNDGPCLAWKDVSPPVDFKYKDLMNYGLQTIGGAMPDAPTTIYVGTCLQGLWKSTDSGDTWTKTNTGKFYNNDGSIFSEPPYTGNPNNLDSGRNWTLAVDPTDSNVVYTTAGYGFSQSLWKSTNGGVDWREMFGEAGKKTSAVLYTIAIDPLNHQHLITTHVSWVGSDSDAGMQESFDGGESWTPHPPDGKENGTPTGWGHGQYAFFLGQKDDGTPDEAGKYWIVTTQNDGVWRTTDGSKTWNKVADFDMTHGQESLFRTPSTNALYLGAMGEVYRSLDNGASWQPTGAQTGSDGYGGIVGDGAHIWAMLSNTGIATGGPYQWQILPENDTTSSPGDSHWSFYSDQMFANGPMSMLSDSKNHILFASLWSAGLWRLTFPKN